MPDEAFFAALSAIKIPVGMPNSQKLKDELVRREKTSTDTRQGDAEFLLQLVAASQLEVLDWLAARATRPGE